MTAEQLNLPAELDVTPFRSFKKLEETFFYSTFDYLCTEIARESLTNVFPEQRRFKVQ